MELVRSILLLAVLAAACYSVSAAGATVLDEVPLIDGHNDLSAHLRSLVSDQINDFDFDSDLTQDSVWNCSNCATDLPRLRAGKLGAQFWTTYVDCASQYKDAVAQTLEQIDVVKRLIAKYPDDLQFVDSAAGILEAFAAGKIGSLIALEAGHSIDSRLAALRMYYELGARYMSITHACNTPWADSSIADDEGAEHNGLTDFGRTVIREMNRLGMLVDLSHTSHQTKVDAINASLAPIIFSHTNAWALCNSSFNIQDDILQMVTENGGIVMTSFASEYLRCDGVQATLEDVVAHINYFRTVAGVDHVGIGSYFEGGSLFPIGLEDVSRFPDLFDRLANNTADEPEWSDEDLRKLAGLNLLRVFREVEQVRDALANELVNEELLPEEDIPEESVSCRSDNI